MDIDLIGQNKFFIEDFEIIEGRIISAKFTGTKLYSVTLTYDKIDSVSGQIVTKNYIKEVIDLNSLFDNVSEIKELLITTIKQQINKLNCKLNELLPKSESSVFLNTMNTTFKDSFDAYWKNLSQLYPVFGKKQTQP